MSMRLEADFRQYYNIDIRDVFDKKSDVTARLVIDLITQLPESSRFCKYIMNDALDDDQHIFVSILDTLNTISYQSAITAAGTVGKEYSKAMSKAPKPIERPKLKPEAQPERKFISTKDLIAKINGINSAHRR